MARVARAAISEPAVTNKTVDVPAGKKPEDVYAASIRLRKGKGRDYSVPKLGKTYLPRQAYYSNDLDEIETLADNGHFRVKINPRVYNQLVAEWEDRQAEAELQTPAGQSALLSHAQAEAETAKAEAAKAKAEAEKALAEAEAAKAEAEKVKAEAAKAQAEAEKAQAEADKSKAEAEKAAKAAKASGK